MVIISKRYLDSSCEATLFAVLVTTVAGFVAAVAKCYRDGWWGNHFAAMWICIFGAVLSAQSFYLYKKPQLSTKAEFRFWLWLAYVLYMASAAVVIVFGYAIVPQPGVSAISPIAWWTFTWFPPLSFMSVYLLLHNQQQCKIAAAPVAAKDPAVQPKQPAEVSAVQRFSKKWDTPAEWQKHWDNGTDSAVPVDTELGKRGQTVSNQEDEGATPRHQEQQSRSSSNSSGAAGGSRNISSSRRWRACIRRFTDPVVGCLGWSSLPLVACLTFFLVLQAAWLAADHNKFPAEQYGKLVAIPVDNTDYIAVLFIRCVGPDTPGLSTFVLEADASGLSATLFGLQDELAAAGRRSCAYDRLGFGWSDDYVVPGHLKRVPFTLYALLRAANVAPPYILVGHGKGGQLALQYATMYPEQVSGIALLDSYSETAAHLTQGVIVNDTDRWGVERYKFLHVYPAKVLAGMGLLRAVTPFAWPRFASRAASSYAYQAAVNALLGNNKAWQGRWGEYAAAVAALPDSLDEQLLLAAPNGDSFWYGTGWKDFRHLPVAIMPAASTMRAAGCDITVASCQQTVVEDDGGSYYAKQVLAYLATLSANASLAVVQGDHSYPWSNTRAAATVLLEKFNYV